MIAKKYAVLAAVAVCALMLPVVGSTKNPVQRPFQIRGEMVISLNLTDGSFVAPNWGEATHVGRYTNLGTGWMNPDLEIIYAEGTMVAANGDQAFWTMHGPTWMDVEGGTGRLQNLTGRVAWVFSPTDYVVEGNIMTIYGAYTGEGTVTY